MNNIPLWENIVIALIGSGLFGGIVSIILILEPTLCC